MRRTRSSYGPRPTEHLGAPSRSASLIHASEGATASPCPRSWARRSESTTAGPRWSARSPTPSRASRSDSSSATRMRTSADVSASSRPVVTRSPSRRWHVGDHETDLERSVRRPGPRRVRLRVLRPECFVGEGRRLRQVEGEGSTWRTVRAPVNKGLGHERSRAKQTEFRASRSSLSCFLGQEFERPEPIAINGRRP